MRTPILLFALVLMSMPVSAQTTKKEIRMKAAARRPKRKG